MYNLLKKMRDYYPADKWLKLVEQAYVRNKLTKAQYTELTGSVTEEIA